MLETIVVRVNDALNSLAIGIPGIAIERETVANAAINLSPETEREKAVLVVVVLENLAHTPDGHGVGVLNALPVQVVQRFGVVGHPIGGGEVYGHHEV